MKLIDKLLAKTKLSANRRKVIRNVYWAVLGKVVNVISGLLVGVMVARYLGPEKFGLMNYVISYVMLFSVLAKFGMENITVRELARNHDEKDRILGTTFFIRLVFALITVVLIGLTLWWFESDFETIVLVMIYSVSLILTSLDVIRQYFTSIVMNEYVVKTEISRTLIGSGIKVVLLLNHCSLMWFIIASTLEFALIGGGFVLSYRKLVGPLNVWRFDKHISRILIRESFPMLLSGTALLVYQKVDAIMIRNMLDETAVGQFSVASKLTELSIFVPFVIAQSIAPLLVKTHRENPELYHRKRQQFVDIMVWSSIAIALLMCISAAPVVSLLYGTDYRAAIPVLQIMSWKTVASALANVSGQIIIIERLQRYVGVRNVIGCLVCISLNYLLIPMMGIIGSAISSVVTVFFAGYFSHFFIRSFHFLVPIQTKAVLFGWKILLARISRRH